MQHFNFHRSLKAGAAGEAKFATKHPQLQKTDGLKHDFVSVVTNLKYELKTESRTTFQTPNIALEWSSSYCKRGAIHNALAHSDIIVFAFANGREFAYKVKELYYWTRRNKKRLKKVTVSNGTYKSIVILVPRYEIKFLEVRIE